MATRTYLNFDLLLEKEADGSYAALVTGSPVGAASSVRFRLPFDGTTLENLLLKLDPGRSGTRRAGANAQQQAAMDFGGPLYDAIFRDDVLLAWSRSQDLARDQGGGLRLRLRLTEAGEIAGLPWELLYDKPNNNFLAQSERTPLVRYLDIPAVPRVIKVDGPLRVLAIISSPVDLEILDIEGEWARLQEAMKDRIEAGSVVLDRLPKPVVSELGPWLRHHQTHVIHFVGHGDFDERLREGVIYFQNKSGASAPVTSSVLGPYVRDHDPLRMVVLNACRSARTDAVDPFGGIAQGLVQQDATAVVAMQFPISDRAAVAFTGDFYGSLVDGLPVDQAVTSARKALLGEFRDEWATPVLFLRAPDGEIFEGVHAPTSTTLATAAAPLTDPPAGTQSPQPATETTIARSSTTSVAGATSPQDHGTGGGRRPLLVGGGAAAAAALVAVAVFVALNDGDGDPGGGTTTQPSLSESATSQPPTTPAGQATAVLPVAAVPLTPDQLLIAAGPRDDALNIYRVDLAAGTATAVTAGDGRKAGPSIGGERDTLIFSERIPDTTNFRLRTVDPATGESDAVLLEGVPAACAQSMERPARSPNDSSIIISPCKSASGLYSLVELNLATGDSRILDNSWARLGDPTISRDGRTVVYWTSDNSNSTGGNLFSLDLTDPAAVPEQFTFGDSEDSDAIFSPIDDTVAFRRAVTATNFDLFTRSIASFAPATVLVGGGTFDQDPTYSPDGTRIAFKRGTTTAGTRTFVIDLTTADPAATAVPLLPEPIDGFKFEAVPSWSRR